MGFKANSRILIKCLIFIMAVSLTVPLGTFSHAAVADKVIIVVNDEVITQREFDRAYAQIKNAYEANFKGEELQRRLAGANEGLKEQLINSKLAVSLAKKQDLKIDQDELEARINKIKAFYPTEEEFLKALNDRGTNLTEFEREIKDQMLAQKIVEQEVSANIVITPADVKDLYEKNKEQLVAPKRVKLRGILVRKTTERKDDDSKKMANKLRSKAKKPEDFAVVATESSEGPYAAEGGEMGYVVPGQMLPEIDEVIFNMKTGQVSDVLETDVGYHIFLAEEVEEPRNLAYDEVSDFLREQLFMKRFQEDLVKWLQEKRKNAYISYK